MGSIAAGFRCSLVPPGGIEHIAGFVGSLVPADGIESIAGFGGSLVPPGGIESIAGYGGPLVLPGGCGKHIERSIVGRKLGLGVVCGSFSHSPG